MPEHIDPFDRLPTTDRGGDELRDIARPRPGHPLVGRVRDRLEPWLAWFGLRRLLATAVTIVVVIVGGWWLLRAPAPPTEVQLPFAGSLPPSSTSSGPPPSGAPPPASAPPASIVVHVAGAVVAPGVYELAGAARTADAITAAGGAGAGADVDALNLAAPLRDGERVYVPTEGEVVAPPVGPAAADVVGGTVPVVPVDINRATAAELDALPGIGPATAQAIVTHRDTHGPFAAIDDLEQVRGIGPAKVEAVRPLVTL